MKMRYLAMLPVVATALLAQLSLAQVPVVEFDKAKGTIGFNVKASVAIAGKFDKWDATLTFTSRDVTTGVLETSRLTWPASTPEAA
jgi:polyisoprenoid-binding protein YceI